MPAITDHDLTSLQDELAACGIYPSHARRLLRAFYDSAGTIDLQSLPLGKALHRKLLADLSPRQSKVIARHQSADGTVKLLLEFTSGAGAVETVLMPAYRADRAAGCVSSQIGCAMGCDFCASTRQGLERNLSAGEIVEQFLHLKGEASKTHRRIASLVFMGMGEPMHNLDAVLSAIERIARPEMGSLGFRAITVSTVGVIAGIERLAAANLGVHLALSLHAPDDATRARIVPTAKRYRVADIMAAAKHFEQHTGRIVNIEYCLLAGVNDADEQARALSRLMAGFRAHVNLIPYNSIGAAGLSGAIYTKPSADRLERFMQILRSANVIAHFRRTRGDDVNAACGQLRETRLVQIVKTPQSRTER
jgi:23S rRNA (adenine2503-C2)-methyltransferase